MTIGDQDSAARAILAGLPSRGRGIDWFLALSRPFSELMLTGDELLEGLADVELAVGRVLDLHGALLGEPRGGLGDAEYRRVLAGAYVAEDAVSTARVWAGWVALAGTEDATIDRLSPASIFLSARVVWAPTEEYLARAGAVVRRLIGVGSEGNAVLFSPIGAVFDEPIGYDADIFAHSLIVMG